MSGEFDRKAALWVAKHYPERWHGVGTIVVGSVEFGMDSAAYASGAWSRFEVSWVEEAQLSGWPTPAQRARCETMDESAWDYDATDLLRELVEMEDPGMNMDPAVFTILKGQEAP